MREITLNDGKKIYKLKPGMIVHVEKDGVYFQMPEVRVNGPRVELENGGIEYTII